MVFKKTEKVLLKDRTMFILYGIVFFCPTDDFRWIPRYDLVCCKSLIRDGEGRISRALRRLQCFVRLGMVCLDLAEFAICGQKEPDNRRSTEIKDVYKVNELNFLEVHLTYLYIQTI